MRRGTWALWVSVLLSQAHVCVPRHLPPSGRAVHCREDPGLLSHRRKFRRFSGRQTWTAPFARHGEESLSVQTDKGTVVVPSLVPLISRSVGVSRSGAEASSKTSTHHCSRRPDSCLLFRSAVLLVRSRRAPCRGDVPRDFPLVHGAVKGLWRTPPTSTLPWTWGESRRTSRQSVLPSALGRLSSVLEGRRDLCVLVAWSSFVFPDVPSGGPGGEGRPPLPTGRRHVSPRQDESKSSSKGRLSLRDHRDLRHHPSLV